MSRQASEHGLDANTIRQYEAKYVLHPWQAEKGFSPLVADRARGNYFYDASGKQYLDFTSQFVFSNLGHADERIVSAIVEQAARLPAMSSPLPLGQTGGGRDPLRGRAKA